MCFIKIDVIAKYASPAPTVSTALSEKTGINIDFFKLLILVPFFPCVIEQNLYFVFLNIFLNNKLLSEVLS